MHTAPLLITYAIGLVVTSYLAGLAAYVGVTAASMYYRHGIIDWEHMARHVAIFTIALIVSAYVVFNMIRYTS